MNIICMNISPTMDPTVMAILALCLHLDKRRAQLRRRMIVMSAALVVNMMMKSVTNAACAVVSKRRGGAHAGARKRPRYNWSSRAHIEGHSFGMYERDLCGMYMYGTVLRRVLLLQEVFSNYRSGVCGFPCGSCC